MLPTHLLLMLLLLRLNIKNLTHLLLSKLFLKVKAPGAPVPSCLSLLSPREGGMNESPDATTITVEVWSQKGF